MSFQHPGRKLCTHVAAWLDVSLSPELVAAYRGRQFRAVLRRIPFSSVGNIATAIALVLAFWPRANHSYLVAWAAMVSLLGCTNLVVWWRHRSLPESAAVSKAKGWWFVIGIAAAATLFALAVFYLFGLSDADGRMLLVATAASLVATGSWMFAYLPWAAVAWALILCAGAGLAFTAQPAPIYSYMTALVMLYSFVMVAAILVTWRMFRDGLNAETEIERQKQLVGLLLNDFEENASDWLWETDRSGRLRHVSVRLAAAMGVAPALLRGRSMVEMLSAQFPQLRDEEQAMFMHLQACMAQDTPFRQVVVPVLVGEQLQWWSLTAKPLLGPTGLLQGWRGVGSDITVARLREMEMVRLAHQDALTGLANRLQFGNALEAYFSPEGCRAACTLLLFDLDNFKTVNDSLGHAVGDLLLKEVARRLTVEVGPRELLARLGGDEFALIVPGLLPRAQAQAYGERLQAALGQAWSVNSHRIEVRASIGIGFAPQDAHSAEQLLKVCDMALYAAKAAGRHTLCFFEPAMDARAQHKLNILSDLGHGLERGEFVLHYQPQIDLLNGTLVGFEALVRWMHPQRGMVSPAEFIPAAEESGLILPLGAWVLRQACMDAMHWPHPLRVAVNLSAVQLASADVLSLVDEALLHSGLPGNRLELEITESTLMRDSLAAQTLLGSFRRKGIRIALDDFGTGYSSLSYLRSFPLDKLKIDRSFVSILDATESDASAVAIVQTIIALAQALALETTAEGVETPAQRHILERIGCSHGQGYLFAKPMDAKLVGAFTANWTEKQLA